MTALPSYDARQRVTWFRVLRSEWTKLRSLPSTAWSLLATVALVVGVGVMYSLIRVTRPPSTPAAEAGFDPTAVSLGGVQLAQLAIGILGVLLITGEYSTGMVRTSFAAVPRRLPVLWGKAVAFGLTTLTLCVPATAMAFLAGQMILAREHLDIALGNPGTTRAVAGSALYLTGVGLLGLGLGALLRSTAGAVGALFGVLFGFQIVAGFLPDSWSDHVYKYLPAPAGAAVTFQRPDESSLPPWAGLGVFAGYIAVLLVCSAWRMRSRDA